MDSPKMEFFHSGRSLMKVREVALILLALMALIAMGEVQVVSADITTTGVLTSNPITVNGTAAPLTPVNLQVAGTYGQNSGTYSFWVMSDAQGNWTYTFPMLPIGFTGVFMEVATGDFLYINVGE
jgi:hypothetical protein